MRRDAVAERIRRLSPVKRRLLERLLEERSYDPSSLEVTPVSPRSPLEVRLAEIWKEVLGVDEVGVEDNFFDLGGDSILSIRIVAKAQSRAIPLSSRLLFEAPTIAELAELLEPRWSPSREAASEARRGHGATQAHGSAPGAARPQGTAPSPGDFPEAELSPEDLSTVLARVAARATGTTADRTGFAPRHAAAL